MSLRDSFFDLPPELLSAIGTVLGFAMTDGLTYNQQNALGNWLELVGQILETNSAQGQYLQQLQQAQQQALQLGQLQKTVDALQKEVERLGGGPFTAPPPR